MIAALLPAVSLFLSVATPKYFFPFALIKVSMLHGAAVPAWRGASSTVGAARMEMGVAKRLRRRSEGCIVAK
jgi:hypothetical protein